MHPIAQLIVTIAVSVSTTIATLMWLAEDPVLRDDLFAALAAKLPGFATSTGTAADAAVPVEAILAPVPATVAEAPSEPAPRDPAERGLSPAADPVLAAPADDSAGRPVDLGMLLGVLADIDKRKP